MLQYPTNGNPPTLFLVLRGKFFPINDFFIYIYIYNLKMQFVNKDFTH